MRYRRVIEAYGLGRDVDGRILGFDTADGGWAVPGEPVRHGEHPEDAVARAAGEQLGGTVEIVGVSAVVTDIDKTARMTTHYDRIVFDVRPVSVAHGVWLSTGELSGRALAPATASILGRGGSEIHQVKRVAWSAVPGDSRSRRQRFAAYGLATDPTGNILLTLISDGYPGAGRWHLPGGGTDFGESATAGLVREIEEETGQHGVVTGLVAVSHRHHREARGPEGRAMDWHGVRAVYRVAVERPTRPRVMEKGGSTAAAGWFPPARALELSLTELAHDMVLREMGGRTPAVEL
jgi:ADP-ribose pyrophosphatase YjhB (NUDIX family)